MLSFLCCKAVTFSFRGRLAASLLILFVTRMWTVALGAQVPGDTLRFRVMGYNVENLFDCRHDTLHDDSDFLPSAARHWTDARYRKKLDDVARVIVSCGCGWEPPALVALCEVENEAVLRDLTRRSALRAAGYRYVATDSPDRRGIDVALLYLRSRFRLLSASCIRLNEVPFQTHPTRDILHVSGCLPGGDTLDVFVCHFPSRSGGARASEPRRLLAARRLARATDSLLSVRRRPQLLVMGDFNDCPSDKSLRLLRREGRLRHLLDPLPDTLRPPGSYKYRGRWQLLDHLLVSPLLLDPASPLRVTAAGIHALPFLLSEDRKYGGLQPFRTYYGVRYQGGYSDHLPVWAEFVLEY